MESSPVASPSPVAQPAARADSLGPPPNFRARRRGSVSAEVASQFASAQKEVAKPRKAAATEQIILKAMSHSFLFSDLEDEQKAECMSSMFHKPVDAEDVLMRQGEQGDNFYVITEGIFEASILQPDGSDKVVFTYESKGAFGELALMYNCPRAATVKAKTRGALWGMDRSTFRRIILFSRMAQRERFEEVLNNMKIFSSLSFNQRASIADCLVLEVIEEGAYVLKQGEALTAESKYYLVEEGTVACYRSFEGERKFVKDIEAGGFFGEVALVTQSATRAADCVAKTRCKLLAMGRDAFERLMGPTEDILKKEVLEYEALNAKLSKHASNMKQLQEEADSSSGAKDPQNADPHEAPVIAELSDKGNISHPRYSLV